MIAAAVALNASCVLHMIANNLLAHVANCLESNCLSVRVTNENSSPLSQFPMKNVRLIRTRTTKVAFKAMYKAIGFSDDAAIDMTDTEVVDSMPNLVIAAAVALNASHVSCTIECADIRSEPSDLFDLHEGQLLLEGQWVNKEWADAFRPL